MLRKCGPAQMRSLYNATNLPDRMQLFHSREISQKISTIVSFSVFSTVSLISASLDSV